MPKFRIGQGWDFHRFVAGRRLMLGGVEVPHHQGLEGHSDADVILHAVCDAILGAMGLRDIGHHFPNTDMRFKDADSLELLRESWRLALRSGANEIGNLDITVMAESPKLAPFIGPMKIEISEILQIPVDLIGIKATTTEQMGAVGRGEGIAATAIVLIYTNG